MGKTDQSSELKLTYFSIAKAAKAQAKVNSNGAFRPLASELLLLGAAVVLLPLVPLLVFVSAAGEGTGAGFEATTHVSPDLVYMGAWQLSHSSAPFVVQDEPDLATPFAQVHTLSVHAEFAKVYPAEQSAQLGELWTGHEVPVLPLPLLQVQVFIVQQLLVQTLMESHVPGVETTVPLFFVYPAGQM